MSQITHNLSKFQTPSIVSYRKGIVKACGAEAVEDFEEDEKNVAYWFKVTVHSTMSNPHLSMTESDS